MLTTAFLLLILFLYLLPVYFIKICNREFFKAKTFKDLFLILSLTFIFALTLLPVPFDYELLADINEVAGETSVNLIPFRSIMEYISDYSLYNAVIQIVGNIVLFIPLGIALMVELENTKKAFCKTICASLAISVMVEVTQFLLSKDLGAAYRMADIDDVFLNLIGGIVGATVFLLFKNKILPIFLTNKK